MRQLRFDNVGEYTSIEFKKFRKGKRIARHYTTLGNPQSNGVAERMNQALLKKAHCPPIRANLPKEFWAEALFNVAYLINKSPSTAIKCKTLAEVWSRKPADHFTLRIFGCPAYRHDDKVDLSGRKSIFIDYADGYEGYILWCSDIVTC